MMRKCAVWMVAATAAVLMAGCVSTGSKSTCPTVGVNKVVVGDAVEDSWIKNWQVLGPFCYEKKDYANEQDGYEALGEKFVKNAAALVPKPCGTKEYGQTWKKCENVRRSGFVNLNAMYGDPEYKVAYMSACICTQEAMTNCKLLMGSDDFIRVWLNGKVVHSYDMQCRPAEPDEDRVEGITLNKGCNILTIKCVDVIYDWGVYCRLENAAGKPLVVTE